MRSTSHANVLILALSQALILSAIVLAMVLAAILGAMLAPDKGLATLPVSAMVIGTALASLAARLMRRVGRRPCFMLGALLGIGGSLLCALALYRSSFATFVSGNFLLGSYQGFANDYRFAAVEAAGPAHAGKAISLVVAGGMVRPSSVPNSEFWGATGSAGGSLSAPTRRKAFPVSSRWFCALACAFPKWPLSTTVLRPRCVKSWPSPSCGWPSSALPSAMPS